MMATQGIVSITENGKVIMKAIAGCDGYGASKLAKWIQANWPFDLETFYTVALNYVGCDDCLAVMDSERIYFPGGDDDLPLYRETFSNPRFNPRWECGLVEDDCLAVVELNSVLDG